MVAVSNYNYSTGLQTHPNRIALGMALATGPRMAWHGIVKVM